MHLPALILLRGLPGSGKTSLAGILRTKDTPVFSVDDYFTSSDGVYHFEFDKNHLAYATCIENTRNAMKQGVQKIIIDNTFTLEWEMEPYFKLASEFQYFIFVVTVENRNGNSNVHDVSQDQLQKMAEKYKVVLY